MSDTERKLDPVLASMVERGLMTAADALAVDVWAEDLGKAQARGEVSEAEADRAVLRRVLRDAARRGRA